MQSVAQLSLDSPLSQLRGVGPALAKRFERLALYHCRDLLFHLPIRYEDRTRLTGMSGLRAGTFAVVEGDIIRAQVVFMGRKRSLRCELSDGKGMLTMVLFHFSMAQKKQLGVGGRLRCMGDVRLGPKGWQMIHPNYQRVPEGVALPLEDCLTPVYPSTEGVTQHVLRRCVQQVLALLPMAQDLDDVVPPACLDQYGWPGLKAALIAMHRPQQVGESGGVEKARRRLVVEELAAHQLALLRCRAYCHQYQVQLAEPQDACVSDFLKSLPFALTAAQARVVSEIMEDLRRERPMMRLLQGDVGSGKTVVAALAILHVLSCGMTAVLMAPTEILSQQHAQTFKRWFKPLGLRVGLLTGHLGAKEKAQLKQNMADGMFQLMVGTHALFQQDVAFSRVGLVVIDEQHRFGVAQRLALWRKAVVGDHAPHQLVMTATPIPRTLAMLTHADLDVSVIDALPPGRHPIVTSVMPDTRRAVLLERVARHCHQHQCYWVCPLIDESDNLQCQAAEKTHAWLHDALPDLRIACVHGRMRPQEKHAIMQAFQQRRVDLLVSTTVIEVGVDVPSATLMIIENAERLGLSQLHQLRGRVGRGLDQSHCVLLYQAPLSQEATDRLALMRDTQDGFVLAQKDLVMRGPGDLVGTRQTGLCAFRLADMASDQSCVEIAAHLAEVMCEQAPEGVQVLLDRWVRDAAACLQV